MMKRKPSGFKIFLLVICLSVIYFGVNGGYAFSKANALKNSNMLHGGDSVYEITSGTNTIVIWHAVHKDQVVLVKKKWGLLYRVEDVSQMYPSVSEPKTLFRTWSAQMNGKKRYEAIIAAQTLDPKVKSIVVSNDSKDADIADHIEEIKNSSTFFIELPVTNGYAATYQVLDPGVSTGFVFRTLDQNGSIISTSR
ncbi:hypothetical protein [Paenibacillus glycanilyticus]|uniref:hypothetical protein n=1 Tax=Paenibacillus glycanilyticus TaxID=126569 RepID=UPI000FD98172|nr:hypothetical protein [Paenibacillus glycanilyticus]